MYMSDTSKGVTKVGFVGTNLEGSITIMHIKVEMILGSHLMGMHTIKL
ncbi:hypothetical protein SAMN02583745_00136 [Thorsellia anophelis DSM 18579]|uniref:Uncharacterized protein n=1 Tax=Thorsellia anophelis DSM 18579 TaxID=1123402 RepID=A0A1H9Y9I6_9GAMM|nr:hypothetical protein SAMN02583745_00136 [Thorsellia anophelis DSM 18579]